MPRYLLPTSRAAALSVLLVLTLWPLATATAARSELLVFSAVDFIKRCFAGCADDSTLDNGVLKPTTASFYYKSISFPKDGQKVCKFSLVYHDINNTDPLVARLMKKKFKVGEDAFSAPVVMATVSSGPGVVDAARRASTTNVASRTIQKKNAFYYVEVDSQTIHLNIIGVQIDVRSTCS